MGSDVVIAVCDPLVYLVGGLTENTFRFSMPNHGLKDGVLSGFIEDSMDSCFQQALVLLLMRGRMEVFIPNFPDLEHCLPDESDAFQVICDSVDLWVVSLEHLYPLGRKSSIIQLFPS